MVESKTLGQSVALLEVDDLGFGEVERGRGSSEHRLKTRIRSLTRFEAEVANDFVLDFGWQGTKRV